MSGSFGADNETTRKLKTNECPIISRRRSAMAQSARILYRGQQGLKIRKNFNWPPINLDSAVIITAAEFRPAFGGLAIGIGGLIFPGALGVGYDLIG